MAVTCLHRHSQMLVDTNNYVSKKFSLKVLPLVGTDRQICILFSWRESGIRVSMRIRHATSSSIRTMPNLGCNREKKKAKQTNVV